MTNHLYEHDKPLTWTW